VGSRRIRNTKYPELVRDSFLDVIGEKEANVIAMPVDDDKLPEPEKMAGMRIWFDNGVSIVCLFAMEDEYTYDS
jgi:hypothetical protein